MTELFTDEIVGAAARAVYLRMDSSNSDPWDSAMERAQRYTIVPPMIRQAREYAEAALTAALPMLVRAEREAREDIAFDHTCDAGPPELCLCSHRIATAIRSRGEP